MASAKPLFKLKRKSRHSVQLVGPLHACIEPLGKLVDWCRELLANEHALCRESARKAIMYPVREASEEKLRGALWFALNKHHTKQKDVTFEMIEELARGIALSSKHLARISIMLKRYVVEDSEKWPDLERIHFMTQSAKEWAKGTEMIVDMKEDVVEVHHLRHMAHQCQSDKVQKKAREAFLMAHVPWYDYERVNAESAFGALCSIANQSVNRLVEIAGVDLHFVLDNDPKENPEYYNIAGIHVFLEYVRCKCARTYVVYPLKDHGDTRRKRGDILYDADLFYINNIKLLGPYETVPACINDWIHCKFVEFEMDISQ